MAAGGAKGVNAVRGADGADGGDRADGAGRGGAVVHAADSRIAASAARPWTWSGKIFMPAS
jgi:hypothetical protein